VKKLLFLFLSFLFLILAIKLFILDAYYVASESMRLTLLAGDFVIGNKIAYKLKTPDFVPFSQIRIPSYTIFELSKPKRNDIVVFRLNSFLIDEKYSEKDLIKRIVGLPGETIQISNNKIKINNQEIDNFITEDKTSIISDKPKILNYSDKNFSYMNYGPLKIPAKGDTIEVNPKNIKFWQPIINYENKGKFISVEGSVITFKGEPINKYALKENYYFVFGDNIKQSVDSRVLGFIPESAIESKVMFVYLSIEPKLEKSNLSFIERVRFNRIFKTF